MTSPANDMMLNANNETPSSGYETGEAHLIDIECNDQTIFGGDLAYSTILRKDSFVPNIEMRRRCTNDFARHVVENEKSEGATITEQLELYRRKEEVLKLELELAKTNLLLLQQKSNPQLEPTSATSTSRSAYIHTEFDNRSFQHNLRELIAIAPAYNPSDKAGPTSKQWLKKINELREVYRLDDKTVLLLASTKLAGAAKYWLQGCQSQLITWNDMQNELVSAFPALADEAEIHFLLSKRRKRPTETFEQYFYEVISVASRIHMSNTAKVRYLINGLPNTEIRTILSLQHFHTPEDLLRQYKCYEETSALKLQERQSTNNVTPNAKENEKISGSERKCYNCDEWGHISINCPRPQRKQRCTKCTKVGHQENECKNIPRVALIQRDEYHKSVTINGIYSTTAFVDMGSDVTLMTESCVKSLGLRYEPCSIHLVGFGEGKCVTIGRLRLNLTIDSVSADIFVYIVSDKLMNNDLILGRNFVDLENIVVVKKKGQLVFLDNESESSNHANCMVNIQNDSAKNKINEPEDNMPADKCEANDDYISQLDNLNEGNLLNNNNIPACNVVSKYLPIDRDSITAPISIDEINGGELDKNQYEKLLKLMNNYRQCFAKNVFELGCSKSAEFKIELKKSDVISSRPYRLSIPQQNQMRSIIQDLLKAKIIQPSNSEYSFPAILVTKKDGDPRMVIDFRKINELTVKDRYPLPVIEDLLQHLSGSRYFIVLDFASGYYQVPVSEESRKFTAFTTHDGEYEFLRMPFGVSNAPSQFQRLMNNLKRKMRKGRIVVYMDDVLIPCTSFDTGLETLEEFLGILFQEGLTLKLKKSYFFMPKVEFLGYEISSAGMRPSATETNAVKNMKAPQKTHELRQFIGLTSYFRKFVPEYGIIALPLTNLLKNDTAFTWDEEQLNAFEKLKEILTARPLLTLFNPNRDHEVHTDACSIGLAGILLQWDNDGQLRPVSYFSRRTTEQERMYHSYELEVLAIVEALKRFRTFLLAKSFKVVTDCEAVRTTSNKKDLIPRIARWWLTLSEFDFNIAYRSKRLIQHVDCLSRLPQDEPNTVEEADLRVFAVNMSNQDWLVTIQMQDPKLLDVLAVLQRRPTNNEEKQVHADYVIKTGRVFRKVKDELKWVVPRNAISRIIKTCHDDLGHLGLERTLDALRRDYWFPRMRNKTKSYISSCIKCAYYKIPSGKAEGELHCIEKAAIPFDTIHVDHLGPFPKSSSGNTHILGIVDGFTKYLLLYPVKNTSVKTTLKVLDSLTQNFGTPSRMITDRGTAFTAREFRQYCANNCIRHILTAARSPRSNGQIERCNRTVLDALRTMADGGKTWDKLLRPIQWGINSARHESTKRSPHELLFGFQPRDPLQNKVLLTLHDDKSFQPTDLQEIRRQAAENIAKSQRSQKGYYDAKRKPAKEYSVGDLVLIERPAVATGDSRKLDLKYKGPYVVHEVLGNDRYKLKDIPGAPRTQRQFEGVYASDCMKAWCSNPDCEISDYEDEADEGSEDEFLPQDGRAVTNAPEKLNLKVGMTDNHS